MLPPKIQYIISNGRVYQIESKISKQISLASLSKHIVSTEQIFSTPQMPLNTVKYVEGEDFQNFYILIPEDFYKLQDRNRQYTVRLPHTLFLFSFKKDSGMDKILDPSISWNFSKIFSINSNSFVAPPMQNVYSSPENTTPYSKVCTSSFKRGIYKHEYMENYIKAFFSSNFNRDLSSLDGTQKKYISGVSMEQTKLLENGYNLHDLTKAWYKLFNKQTNTLVDDPVFLNLNEFGKGGFQFGRNHY